MIFRASLVAASAIALSGCAYLNTDSRVYANSSLFVWDSDYSAGIGTKEGICVQAATTMTAANLEANVAASNDLLKLATPTAMETNSGELIDLGVKQSETVARTNVSTAQTAFTNISLFYLCQVSLNRTLSEESVVAMWRATNETVTSIGRADANPAEADQIGTSGD